MDVLSIDSEESMQLLPEKYMELEKSLGDLLKKIEYLLPLESASEIQYYTSGAS